MSGHRDEADRDPERIVLDTPTANWSGTGASWCGQGDGLLRSHSNKAAPLRRPPHNHAVPPVRPSQPGLTFGSAPLQGPGRASSNLLEGLTVMKSIRVLRAIALIGVGLSIAFVSAGYQGQSAGSGPTEIVLEDLRFVPNRIDAKVGVPITVRLINRGTELHDLNFPSLHMPGLQGVEAILDPGETRTITLTFDQPGTHIFLCTLPGHAASGMTGAAYVSS